MAPTVPPIIAIVGRANVGKSTLFNCLTKTRSALVANDPGLTRDRLYGQGRVGSRPYVVVDTGGLDKTKDAIEQLAAQQTHRAIQSADQLLLVMDARCGLTSVDQSIMASLRVFNKPITLVLNKAEGLNPNLVKGEFFQLGLGVIHTISAAHHQGIEALIEVLLPPITVIDSVVEPSASEAIKMAIVGRPNVGKSTLVNRLLGEERVLVSNQPGTTRDSISVPFYHRDQAYCLIDTAGIRRQSKVKTLVEKFSLIKSLQSIGSSHVVIMMMDAQTAVTEQDLHLLGFILESGRALLIAVNKWDGLSDLQREQMHHSLDRHLGFIRFVKIRFISALEGYGVRALFPLIDQAYAQSHQRLSTAELTRLLAQAVAAHPPPLIQGRPIRPRYAHPGGYNPLVIVVHGRKVRLLPHAYRRYLENFYRQALGRVGTPIQIEFKDKEYRHKPD